MLRSTSLFSERETAAQRTRSPRIDELLSNFLKTGSSRGAREVESQFSLVEHGRRDRFAAEAYIARRFAKTSVARVESFTPRLFTLRMSDGSICGSFGLRSARGRLFVEQFLDRCIEQHIGACSGTLVQRGTIAEVEHLCSSFSTATSALLILLVAQLNRDGFRWLVSAGTRELRDEFERIGLPVLQCEVAASEADVAMSSSDSMGDGQHIFFVAIDGRFDAYRAIRPAGSVR